MKRSLKKRQLQVSRVVRTAFTDLLPKRFECAVHRAKLRGYILTATMSSGITVSYDFVRVRPTTNYVCPLALMIEGKSVVNRGSVQVTSLPNVLARELHSKAAIAFYHGFIGTDRRFATIKTPEDEFACNYGAYAYNKYVAPTFDRLEFNAKLLQAYGVKV